MTVIKKTEIIGRVNDGEQAIVMVVLAKNPGNTPLMDSQLELAINMAKNVVQMTGAEVSASGSVVPCVPVSLEDGGIARLNVELTYETE